MRCFLRTVTASNDPHKAADVIDMALKWRKEFKIYDLSMDTFPEELREKYMDKVIGYKNQDKEGHKILYFDISENNKDPEAMKFKHHAIVAAFESHHRLTPEEQVVVLFDCSRATLANNDMDMLKFVIQCFKYYFPAFLDKMIVYETPKVLSFIWTIIKKFLNAEQAKKVVFCNKNEIKNYISEENLWDHMQ
ncbi:unnamed protein product [Owenia fusiformis]|nr:unnamed protein product [Owenia fusiformis]